jgi:biopolymer transport protein ExbD
MLLRPQESNSIVAIDLTPIIDMVFLLLIFFLVATTFQQTEREMKIALPVASSAGPISAALRELVINVDDGGRIYVSGRQVEAQELRTMISEALAANPKQKVTVRGDRNTPYSAIVVVLDICKGSGIQEPYLDTVMRE